MRLQDKIVAITGGGDGIGKAAAKTFAKEGANVIILEINEDNAKNTVEGITADGGKAAYYKLDVSDYAAVAEVLGKIGEDYGGLDVLYNNASVFWGTKDTRMDQVDPKVFEQIIRINLFGMVYCSKFAIHLMRKRGGGSIVNTASSCGLIGIPDCEAYSASKGAVVVLTKSMAVEYGPEKIRTNCIAPAAIHTAMIYESDLNKDTFDEQKFLTSGTPLRRWGTAQDIANIALFLASE